MTGLAPAEMLYGEPYFDALLAQASERRAIGYDTTELLASLLEVSHASYRVLLHLTGTKRLPDALKVRRPGDAGRRASRRVSWRALAERVRRGH